MPFYIAEGELGDASYHDLIRQHERLIRERDALAKIKRKNRGQGTRFVRLKKEIIPKIVAQLARLQQEMGVY